MRAPGLTVAGIALLLGCHRATSPDPTAMLADTVRCASVADSVAAAVPLAERQIATPIGRPRLPQIPPGTRLVGEIHTTFAVNPGGRVDTATVAVTGLGDPRYREEMVRTLARTRFRTPRVAGCQVGGRGDIRVRMESRVEVRRVG